MAHRTGPFVCGRPRMFWSCPNCDRITNINGHRCTVCGRICCCGCFDHLDAQCKTDPKRGLMIIDGSKCDEIAAKRAR